MSKILSEIIKSERWGILALMTDSMNDDEFNLLSKGWSESAREAAAEARRSRKGGEPTANFKVVFKPSGFDKAGYKALSSTSRESVLKEATKGHKEAYVVKSVFDGVRAYMKTPADLLRFEAVNKAIGTLEGKARGMIKRSGDTKGKESRKWLSVAISLQSKANKQFEPYKAIFPPSLGGTAKP